VTAVSPPVILEEDDSPTKDLEFARRLPFHRHHEERKARRNDLELIGLVVLDSDVGFFNPPLNDLGYVKLG